ncbi:MAG: SpoIID/LytB domain-containing protein [Bacteriovoracaceae bacterium]|nr:SpoIID/LytB domain-containing protein [Bacteriovoracaceae bacterium]
MKKLVLLITLLFVASYARSEVSSFDMAPLFQPESSVPEFGMPAKAALNKSFMKTVRVKIFPHTLKNDWVHGKADDASTVLLKANDIEIDGEYTDSIQFDVKGSKLSLRLANGKRFSSNKVFLKSNSPIEVHRKNNLDKTHSYTGLLEVFLKDKKIHIVNHLSIEEYLKGVVPKESVNTWPLEALKAQAVAARSYAYYHLLTSKGKYFDVDDTARFQVYAGFSAQTPSTNEAIKQTRGEVLTHNGDVIVAFFHAYSGGRTDSAKNIFGNEVVYCKGKPEIFPRQELKDELSPKSKWIVEWTTEWSDKKSFLKKLKSANALKKQLAPFTELHDYSISEMSLNRDFNSVVNLQFSQDRNITSVDSKLIRKAIGWSKFPSYHYRLLINDNDEVAFRGNGWGHHVGLSQWGAFIMAKNYNKTYEEILYHYYTDVELKRL